MHSSTFMISGSNNSSTNQTNSPIEDLALLIGCSFLWGSTFIPVKQYETGDGLFFQMIFGLGIWTVGLVVHWIRNFPKYYALPMLGGFLFALGNVTTVPIIQTIGFGLGNILWNSIGLIVGWATARYGLFGIADEIPSNNWLNYVGVFLSLLSTIIYIFVKPENENKKSDNLTDFNRNENANNILDHSSSGLLDQLENENIFKRINPKLKRIIGVVLSVFSGVLCGESNTPMLYANQHDPISGNYLDYIFSFHNGIFLTSILLFVIYAIFKKNKPDIYPQAILPGLVAGWMWAGANVLYFMVTNSLTQAISLPITSSGPSVFASIWSVFYFREIKGFKNYVVLIIGFIFAIVGSVLTGLSL